MARGHRQTAAASAIALPPAHGRQLEPREFFRSEFQEHAGETLHLGHFSVPLVVGSRVPISVAYGKDRDHIRLGRYWPAGLDALTDSRNLDSGARICRFSDGALAVADASSARLGAYCSCPDAPCRHAIAAITLAATDPPLAWGDARAFEQLNDAMDAYLAERGDLERLLLACDAAYVRLRNAQTLDFDARALREQLRRHLEERAAARPAPRPVGASLRQVMTRPRATPPAGSV